jgi:hypothetical protein
LLNLAPVYLLMFHECVGTVVPFLRAAYGQGAGEIVEYIRCSGTETQLTDCNIRDVLDGECTHSDDASVQCSELYLLCAQY